MTAAIAPVTRSLTPTAFSERLLEAARADPRRDERERGQLAALLRPFLGSPVGVQAFEAALREYQARRADLRDTAREVLALWHLCSA